jgi:hypothetical protein
MVAALELRGVFRAVEQANILVLAADRVVRASRRG